MSVIGPANLGAINLAGSVAGAQQTSADEADQAKQTSAQRDAAANLKAMASKALDGVDAADESAERDADGRMPYGGDDNDASQPATTEAPRRRPSRSRAPRPKDAFGELGGTLDVEA